MDSGRVAVVTGASAGVGRACAQELARRGFNVGLLARGDAGLEGAASDVEAQAAARSSCGPMSLSTKT